MSEFDWYNNIHNFIYREEIIDSEPEINSSEDINKYIYLELILGLLILNITTRCNLAII